MARIRRHKLRGSVRQNVSVRMSARGRTRFDVLLSTGALVVSALIVLGLCVWLWRIDWPQRQFAFMREAMLNGTARAHFSVRDITVEGRHFLNRDTLLSALDLSRGAPILAFDPQAARLRILALPWVADVRIERRLPDKVRVVLQERKPMARWQNRGKVCVIDENGRELSEAKAEVFSQLPLMVGAGAPEATRELLEDLLRYPRVAEVVTAASRVGERRWDLYLQSGVVAKLPEEEQTAALGRLVDILERKKLFQREIKVIDLRLPDRLIIQSDVPVSTDSSAPLQTGEHRP